MIVTGPVLAERGMSEDEIWAIMQKPSVVVDIGELSHQRVYTEKKKESKSPYKPNGKLKKKDDTGCLNRNSYYNILREIRNELGIEHLGTHSMRKTFGYDVYQRYEGQLIAGHYSALDVTQRMLNHSSSYSTLQYIGIDDEIMEQVYDGTCL